MRKYMNLALTVPALNPRKKEKLQPENIPFKYLKVVFFSVHCLKVSKTGIYLIVKMKHPLKQIFINTPLSHSL